MPSTKHNVASPASRWGRIRLGRRHDRALPADCACDLNMLFAAYRGAWTSDCNKWETFVGRSRPRFQPDLLAGDSRGDTVASSKTHGRAGASAHACTIIAASARVLRRDAALNCHVREWRCIAKVAALDGMSRDAARKRAT